MNDRPLNESIWSDKITTIPMADVQNIEKRYDKWDDLEGAFIITSHTKWSWEHDDWENAVWLSPKQLESFLKAWCYFRYEKDIKKGM